MYEPTVPVDTVEKFLDWTGNRLKGAEMVDALSLHGLLPLACES
jgi:hypothetical protein